MQGDEYPVGQAGRFDARPGYSWIAAHFIGECRYVGICAGQDLMIDAPQ